MNTQWNISVANLFFGGLPEGQNSKKNVVYVSEHK